MSGPRPSCTCGSCPVCRSRESSRRAYHRTRGRDVAPLNPRGFHPRVQMRWPEDSTVLAYVAGLFDGEGCITRSNQRLRLQVAMTDEAVIRWLGSFGGTVRERSVVGNRQRCWRWLVMAQVDVRATLLVLMPYLQVKKAAAGTAVQEIDALVGMPL